MLRAKDMDRDGVQAEVIYGILGAATRLNDHEAATEMFRIYNDWLVDFCRHDPDRFIGLACLPYGDIDAAVQEVYRVAKLGLRGMELSCSWDMEPMWHPSWEPLWKAVNDVNLPLHFHTFPAHAALVLEKQTGLTRRAAFFTVVSGVPDEPGQHPGRDHRGRGARALPATCASRSARAASAGYPTRSTAWTSSGRTASATSGSG